MSNSTGVKIMAFTWNTDGLSICKSNVTKKVGAKTQKVGNIINTKNCVVPDFMEELRDKIKQENTRPHILIFSTQGEPNKNTYFKDFLNDTLSTIGYYRISYQKFENISEVQSGNKVRTEFKDGAIRQSIFIENSFKDNIVKIKSTSLGYLFNTALTPVQTTNCQDGERNSGAIATYIQLLGYGTIALITVHLPAGVRALGVNSGKSEDYAYYRENIRAANRLCMLHIIEKFIVKVKDDFNLHYAILMGDLNYTIEGAIQSGSKSYKNSLEFIEKAIPDKTRDFSSYARNLYRGTDRPDVNNIKYADELRQEIETSKTRLSIFQEGVNNKGPEFLPNWNMLSIDASKKGEAKREKRMKNCLKKTESASLCYDNSEFHPCWRDRILYANAGKTTDDQKIKCVEYYSYDSGNINYSDHAAIVGIFDIGNPEPITRQTQDKTVPVAGGAAVNPDIGSRKRATGKKVNIMEEEEETKPQKQPQTQAPILPPRTEEELILKKNKRADIINKYYDDIEKIQIELAQNDVKRMEKITKIGQLEQKLGQNTDPKQSTELAKQINKLKDEIIKLDAKSVTLIGERVEIETKELQKTKTII